MCMSVLRYIYACIIFYPFTSHFINVSKYPFSRLLWASHTLLKLQQQDSAYSQLKNSIMVELADHLESYLVQGNSQYLKQSSTLI